VKESCLGCIGASMNDCEKCIDLINGKKEKLFLLSQPEAAPDADLIVDFLAGLGYIRDTDKDSVAQILNDTLTRDQGGVTQWAYDQICTARTKWQARAELAERKGEEMRAAVDEWGCAHDHPTLLDEISALIDLGVIPIKPRAALATESPKESSHD
jgi:hypothetical protein